MSIPVVLGSNIFLKLDMIIDMFKENFIALLFAFILSFAGIHLLLKFARKMSSRCFVFIFGFITILSVVV